MLGAARAYAEANQAVIMTPFILAGAMSPATVAGAAAQTLAESMAGMAYVQLVRPGAPVVFGSFASSMSMQSGAPTFGTPEPALVLYSLAALRATAARAVPQWRVALRLEDPRRASRLRVGEYLAAHPPRRRELRAPRRGMARGWADHGLREVRDGPGSVRDDARVRERRGPVAQRAGARPDHRERAGPALPGNGAHAGELRDRFLPVGDRRQQQLRAVGGRGVARRGAPS